MAGELSWRHTTTGKTLYVTIRAADKTYWYITGSALEALDVTHWANYAIALTETPASSYFYVGTWPAGLTTAGFYWVDIFQQKSGSAAIGDTIVGGLIVSWDGTTAKPWGVDVTHVLGTIQTAGNIPAELAKVPKSDSNVKWNDTAIDAILDEVVEGSLTFRQVLRLLLSALALKSAGGGTSTITFRNIADDDNRITATVDADGNRTAVTLKGT